jgi:hypothetical protein
VPQAALQHRLEDRPQCQAVGGGDQVDRAAHQDDPHDAAVEEQPGQSSGRKPGTPQNRKPHGHRSLMRLR